MTFANREKDDARWMARALELATRGRGLTSPNPMVGAVIVADGQAVGEGFHAGAGGSHAEIVALGAAGARAHGATLYVTLEPCNHQGRTPPCVPAVIAAGVARVVAAARDPNPRVQGGGAAALRAAVDAVSIRILEDHVQGCVRTAAERGEADRYVDEVVDVVRRTLGRPVRGTRAPG